MPGRSWSLPAHRTCPSAVTTPADDGRAAICASCYASKGAYAWNATQHAQSERFAWVREAMRSDEGRAQFVQTMVSAIKATKQRYFRIHDSGDLFNPPYIGCWADIASQLPEYKFWAPTRVWRMTGNPRWDVALRALGALPNVTLRPSALHVGDAPPAIAGMAAGTTVLPKGDHAMAGVATCEAYTRDGECGPCRVCWDAPETPVAYPIH